MIDAVGFVQISESESTADGKGYPGVCHKSCRGQLICFRADLQSRAVQVVLRSDCRI